MQKLTIAWLKEYRDLLRESRPEDWTLDIIFKIKKVNGKNRRILKKRERNPRYWVFEDDRGTVRDTI